MQKILKNLPNRIKIGTFFLIFLIIIISCRITYTLDISVLLFQGKTIELKAGSGFHISYRKDMTYNCKRDTVKFSLVSNGIMLVSGADKLISSYFTIKTKDRREVIWGKNTYPGFMQIRSSGTTLQLINVVNIEEYIKGVLPDEIPSSWSQEALKAQAVASRTFAFFHLQKNTGSRNYDLESSMLSQLYSGLTRRTEKTDMAVDETYGEIMTYANFPIQSFFFSTCGGQTENSIDIWDKGYPYLTNVKCGFCSNSPHYYWELVLEEQEMLDILHNKGYNIDSINSITITKKTRSGRNKEIQIEGSEFYLKIDGNKFRMMMGPAKLKSLDFSIYKQINTYLFKGHGFGHGVGMCQWGAGNMAKVGFSYHQILMFYYRDVEFTDIDSFQSEK